MKFYVIINDKSYVRWQFQILFHEIALANLTIVNIVSLKVNWPLATFGQ